MTQAAAAARDGDREEYLACFTRRSRPMIEALWLVASRDHPEMAALGAGEIEVIGAQPLPVGRKGERRAVVLTEENGRPMGVVVHGAKGNWRIDLIDTERMIAGVVAPF